MFLVVFYAPSPVELSLLLDWDGETVLGKEVRYSREILHFDLPLRHGTLRLHFNTMSFQRTVPGWFIHAT